MSTKYQISISISSVFCSTLLLYCVVMTTRISAEFSQRERWNMWNVHYESKYREESKRLPLGRFFQSNLKSFSLAYQSTPICTLSTLSLENMHVSHFHVLFNKKKRAKLWCCDREGWARLIQYQLAYWTLGIKSCDIFFSRRISYWIPQLKKPLCMDVDVGNEWLCCSAAHTPVHHFSPVFQFPHWWNLIPRVVCSCEKHKAALMTQQPFRICEESWHDVEIYIYAKFSCVCFSQRVRNHELWLKGN